MARLFSDIPKAVEDELVSAQLASNDGYPQWLNDVLATNPEITGAHLDVVAQELWLAEQDARSARGIPFDRAAFRAGVLP